MKELLEDRITDRIKKVMSQFEPDYSPLAWERLKKKIPVPESRLKKIMGKNRLSFFVVTLAGLIVMVYMIINLLPPDKDSAFDPISFESENYMLSVMTEEKTPPKNITITLQDNLNIDIEHEKKSIPSNITPVQIIDPFLAANNDKDQVGGTVEEISEEIKKNNFVAPVIIERTDLGYKENITEQVPVKFRINGTQPGKNKLYDKTRKLKFNWPDFNLLFMEDEGYDKFAGPNKLSIYYSPEIHSSDSLKTFGVSQGIGISFEGPIHSLVSISAGLSYQSIDFNKKIFFEKVPPDLVLQPSDTTRIFYYLDSIGIRSGSYKFLELPVAVNYKFIENPRSQIWLSAGISSIAFLRQEYTYETIVEDVSRSTNISIKEWRNIHPLASLNFGLLYRYNISDRYILQSSMHYKHHLTTLGYNSMKLNRFNFQIGIVYHFGRLN